jgi:AraC family transcriptional regulator
MEATVFREQAASARQARRRVSIPMGEAVRESRSKLTLLTGRDNGAGDAYGQQLGERLGVGNASAVVTRVLREAEIAVTEIRCDHPLRKMSSALRREDAFFIVLQLRDALGRKYWEDGRQVPVHDLRAGQITLIDLKRDPVVLLDRPLHCLIFYLPRAALNVIADNANAPRIGDLNYKPGVGVDDVVISNIGSLLLQTLSSPDQANPFFVDHVLVAFGVHVALTYGGMRPESRRMRGGLAPWQERRAKEILRANLEGIPLKEVARKCGLSVAHFSRAFRQTLGVAPHNWLIEQRIMLSKERLRDDRLSLTDIAAECGFCDQSHFTHHFSRIVGLSPGAWRRALNE